MKVELLAPAGSYQTAVAAIEAGADAVYMGGMKFGARAYAENGDEDTVIKAIKYAHLHGKALYLTVNTLLKNKELEEELYEYLLPYYRAGLDAVIVQDPGVLLFIKKHFPDLPIHASTQMTITGKYSAKLLEEIGCTRIVTARELSLKEIAAIRKEVSIEIESFVHGALCYCYSGQCLMSSMIGGRSGNRGRCAQPCRLPYRVEENGHFVNNNKNQYALSPKDMCTITILPQIIEAGVYSLKIEGRMKKPEYTAGVVRIYRKYLDLYLKYPNQYRVDRADIEELFDLYNRDGFHTGYYLDHNGPKMMAVQNKKASEGQKNRNEKLFTQIRETYVDRQEQIKIEGALTLKKGQASRLAIGNLIVEGAIVEEAQKQPLREERVRQQIQKTGNTPFVFSHLDIQMDEDIFTPMQSLNELRRNALEKLEEFIVSGYYRNNELLITEEDDNSERNDTDESNETDFKTENLFSVTVETKEQLQAALESQYVKRIYASVTMWQKEQAAKEIYDCISESQKWNKNLFLALPFISREGTLEYIEMHLQSFIDAGLKGYLIRNLESLMVLKQAGLISYCVADANLYTYNHDAQKFYRSIGIKEDTAPYELNAKELHSRNNSNSEMTIYGYLPLMVSAQCVKKNFVKCTGNSDTVFLHDRYNKKFRVKCVCDFCYNVIYNSVPLGILKEANDIHNMKFQRLRLSFTSESGSEMKQLLKEFYQVYYQNQDSKFPVNRFTKGHLKRGVE